MDFSNYRIHRMSKKWYTNRSTGWDQIQNWLIITLSNLFIVNCTWGSWGSWGACSTTCGEGTQQRMRSFDQPAQNGGVACTGASVEGRHCNSQDCPAAGNQMCSNLTWVCMKQNLKIWTIISIIVAFISKSAWNTTIPVAETGSQRIFSVTCNGSCSQLTATVTIGSGDADLYANEDEPPTLSGWNCPDCSMCEAATTALIETCSNISTQNGNRWICVICHRKWQKFHQFLTTTITYNLILA